MGKLSSHEQEKTLFALYEINQSLENLNDIKKNAQREIERLEKRKCKFEEVINKQLDSGNDIISKIYKLVINKEKPKFTYRYKAFMEKYIGEDKVQKIVDKEKKLFYENNHLIRKLIVEKIK